MNITQWNNIISFLKDWDFTIEENFFNEEDLDNCRIIAHHRRFDIRIHFEYDNIRLDLDDDWTDFSEYYTPIEQMDAKFFYILHKEIIAKLDDRY